MASTVLPNGIIIPEKFSRDWYADLYHNWQELDNLLGGGTPKDGMLTIQKNGTTVGTFSANQATDETVNITVPTATSELTNDSNFVQSSDLATVATSGSYNDLSNKPTIPVIDSALSSTSTNGLQNKVIKSALDGKANSTHTHSASDITSGLATVATSGSYNDLSNRPTIPTVNNATLTIQKNGTTVKTFTANASSNVTANITVPTKTSDLTNDSGFITSDTTKIPLAGSNAISGDLIPATDNAIDIGSSTKNLKMLYTKGITIDGKTVDTDANGNMTYDSRIVDTIEEQGNGYIRYSSGLQMCWVHTKFSNSVYNWSFPKTFSQNPVITANINYPGNDFNKYQRCVELNNISNTGVLLRSATHMFGNANYVNGVDYFEAIAIGHWK